MSAVSSWPSVAPVVALDIGNVCVHIQPEECALELGFESVEHIKESKPEIFSFALLLESGRISSSEFLQNIRESINQHHADPVLTQAWNRLIGEEIEGMAEIVGEILNMNLVPIFFSNISDIHYECVIRKLSFVERIGGAVLSYEVGDVKPNSPIYEVMERDFCNGGVPALYLDDRPENIASAIARGWNSYQVGHINGIRDRLSQLRDEM